MIIKVQQEDFDTTCEIDALIAGRTDVGAVVSFTGLVRDTDSGLQELVLEHYDTMTRKQLKAIAEDALKRWDLQDVLIIHRFGALKPGERIVLVTTLSAHRADAFSAAEYLMDWLKTKAPFWKREKAQDGSTWVEASAGDNARAKRWDQS